MNLIAAIVLASLVAAPPPKAEPAKEALAGLQGEWKQLEYTKNGMKDECSNCFVIIKDNFFTVREAGRNDVATFTIDPKADPKTIDLKVQEKDQVLSLKGIYKLEKDKLTICIGLADAERPKEFKSAKGSKRGLFVLERVKK
jgi:uncharacterized protein (TIGR03067 family)